MSPVYHYLSHMSWGLGGICTPHMSWHLSGGIGTSVHLSDISVSQYIHCSSVHNSHTSCSPSFWVVSILDWMPMDLCSASCCWLVLFFVVFSLFLKLLLLQLWLLYLPWLLCAPVCHVSSQLLHWPPPWRGFQWHQVSMMWFCHYHWHQGTMVVLLALPLCCSSNLRCLLRHMPIMPWVLHK